VALVIASNCTPGFYSRDRWRVKLPTLAALVSNGRNSSWPPQCPTGCDASRGGESERSTPRFGFSPGLSHPARVRAAILVALTLALVLAPSGLAQAKDSHTEASPSAESVLRQILYGNQFFRHEFGKASPEYMLPDCFGFPTSLPSILAYAGIKGFSTQKLTWHSASAVGGPDSPEHTPVGIPFNDGTKSAPGFDAAGRSLPAEMLGTEIVFDGIRFRLRPAGTGQPNAVVARGQDLVLPNGQFNRLYLLAASADGDQKAAFRIGQKAVQLDTQDWGGYIGQWDDRTWNQKQEPIPSRPGAPAPPPGSPPRMRTVLEYTGLRPGFIKRAPVAGSLHIGMTWMGSMSRMPIPIYLAIPWKCRQIRRHSRCRRTPIFVSWRSRLRKKAAKRVQPGRCTTRWTAASVEVLSRVQGGGVLVDKEG
jgi:hypothetical protein